MCPCAVQSQWSAVMAWMGWGSYVSADESHLPWRGEGRACVCVCVCVCVLSAKTEKQPSMHTQHRPGSQVL